MEISPNSKLTERNCDAYRNPTGGLALSDADRVSTFANHFKDVFQPNPATSAYTLPTLPYEPKLQHESIEFRPKEIVNMEHEMEKVNYNSGSKAGKRPHNPHVV